MVKNGQKNSQKMVKKMVIIGQKFDWNLFKIGQKLV